MALPVAGRCQLLGVASCWVLSWPGGARPGQDQESGTDPISAPGGVGWGGNTITLKSCLNCYEFLPCNQMPTVDQQYGTN
jgi:hypothetical protein